uniref:Putative tail protein n=1 Tax=viral metagenome TaxID=1070528 RepID=A0A6H1ZDD2_9ZZZZ
MSVSVTMNDKRLRELIKNIPTGEVVRVLHDGVNYGIYQEFGTSRMAAHPFITPAIEHIRPAFEKGLKQIKNLEMAEDFVDKLAHDAEAVAKASAPFLTGALRNSIKVSKPEDF